MVMVQFSKKQFGLFKIGLRFLLNGFYESDFLHTPNLKLFMWSQDFNPNVQHQTSIQVWVYIIRMAQEYWRPNIIYVIVSSVNTPICLDNNTSMSLFDRSFDHCARILIYVDLSY